jgi:hypothetical protein
VFTTDPFSVTHLTTSLRNTQFQRFYLDMVHVRIPRFLLTVAS